MRLVLVLVSSMALAACNMVADAQHGDIAPATGSGAQRSFQVASFDAIALGGHHNVIVTVGPAASVRAEGDEGELERLEIRNDGNRLWIGTKEGSRWVSGGDRSPVTVHVTVPALAKAAIGGSGNMRIDTVQGGSFEGAIGGSGDMEIAALQVEQAGFNVAGSGNIRTTGQANSLSVNVAGSGDLDLGALRARTANISVVGSGNVAVNASESAEVSIMGSGDVTVAGGARCSVNKMGSGEVNCGG